MKKTLILTALAVIGFTGLAQAQTDLSNPNFDLIKLTNVPSATSHSATNGNTNFSSQMIDPNGKDISVWIKFRGTNATTTGTAGFTSYVAPDKTNFAPLLTNTVTYNGTNPVIARFQYPATNFAGVANFKYGAITNVSTNFGVIDWIWIGRPK